MNPLAGWENFYVIVGSAAGALIGLQFVVMTLVTQKVDKAIPEDAGAAFTTPTVVHFGAVLLLSGALTAPWKGTEAVAVLWGLVGVAGFGYSISIARHLRRQITYRPEFVDWMFYLILPMAAYLTLVGCAIAIRGCTHGAPFGIGAAALTLLFVGIHNAWDVVTYHVFARD